MKPLHEKLLSSPNASIEDPATLNAAKSLDYEPHPCGSPFGLGIACLNSFQTNLSRHKHSGMT